VRGIRDSVVMCPPLIVTHDEIDFMIDTIKTSLDQCLPRLRAL
jgi:putrescine aminotransferase